MRARLAGRACARPLSFTVRGRMNTARWHQPLPPWARAVCVLFGLVTIGAAITKLSDMTLPGVLVGAAWAFFGWKGVPLVASAPLYAQPQGDNLAEGLRTLRRRRVLAFVAPFIWLFAAAALLPQIPRQFLSTAFVLSSIPVFFFLFRWSLSACPRCGQHFFISDKLFNASLTRCCHCGLSLRDAGSATSNNRWRGP